MRTSLLQLESYEVLSLSAVVLLAAIAKAPWTWLFISLAGVTTQVAPIMVRDWQFLRSPQNREIPQFEAYSLLKTGFR